MILAVAAAALLALLLGATLLAGRFERFVGTRYLRRGRPPRVARLGLPLAILLCAGAAAAMVAARGHSRALETAAVIVALLAALAAILFALLRLFSVFTTVSTTGVVLGVASLVVVLAVTSGFEREFREKVLAVNAHLIVMAYGTPPDMAAAEREIDEARAKLAGLPGLRGSAKFSFSAGEVMIGPVGANLKGIDLKEGGADLARALIAGSTDALARPASCPSLPACADDAGPWTGRIVLGAELARRIRAGVGDCVSVMVPFAAADPTATHACGFRVVGLFRFGFHEYDARLAYVSLEDARRLESTRQSVFGLELRFDDPDRAMRAEPEAARRLGPSFRTLDWRTLNHNLFTALGMQRLIIALLLVLITVVAAFNILASLTLVVLSKTREIAILAALGARRLSLLRVFLAAGGLVGACGTGLGIAYGLAVCALARLYGYPLDPKVYLIAELPVQIRAGEILFVAAATMLICLLATLYPAWRASRLRVVEGLRHG